MKTSDKGIVALMIHEGVVPGPYLDSRGFWTYGVGHAETSGLPPDPRKMKRGMPADLDAELQRVFAVLRADLPVYEVAVRKALPNAKQHEFDAAVSFHFNTGEIENAKWVPILRAGDAAGAARSMFANWSGRNPELKKRREAERDLLLLGKYPTGAINVWGVTEAGKVIWRPVRSIPAADALAMLKGTPVKEPSKDVPQAVSTGWLAKLLQFIFGGKK